MAGENLPISYQPLVSVVMPAYNASEFIAEAIKSVLSQTYQNFELIVIDDGSVDTTGAIVSELIEKYTSTISYHYQNNSGAGIARNTGITHSLGDLICFIDADDIMVPDHILRQVDFMERHSNVGLVFCDYRNFNEGAFYLESHFQTCPQLLLQLKAKKELILEDPCLILAQENFGIAGTLLFRKSMLQYEPCFEPTLRVCEDFHFYYRLARHSSVGIVNEVGMLRRLHENNTSSDPTKMLSDGIYSRSLLRDNEQDPRVCTHLNRYIAGCQMGLARYYANHSHYLRAMQKDWQALSGNPCWSQAVTAWKGIARTILMAMGLKKVGDNGANA
ncbi:glycosyltransferase family 2 protein [Oryzomonas sagensis]|uniref:Glycosyltransferase family 2 protein n=1 Tax=Oryzomonas sagensis TaxID=2603857 RepID=A0ABQ6TKK2_9BACT|nr:glycosyltransferase family 2 protein [Oryzomonas sagensis]KAB0668518.1 glycosyltransferase family 2 protein [Oryzomonas sagensis]